MHLYERESRIGGHTNTVTLEDGPDAGTPIDTGFIVLNDRTYPTFEKLLSLWNVETRDSDMSFSFWCQRTGLMYNGTDLRGLFVQKRNLIRPSFLGMIRDILRFNREALAYVLDTPGPHDDLERSIDPGPSLGNWLGRYHFRRAFVEDYLIPMAAAIWSTAPSMIMEYPARAILAFYRNHGLLTVNDRPQWKTVVGGSVSYLRAFERRFRGTVVTNARIAAVRRSGDKPTLQFEDGSQRSFDAVVIATHADQALSLLADPDSLEKGLLSAWHYNKNDAWLHHDLKLLPPRPAAWASWNYLRESPTNHSGASSRDKGMPWLSDPEDLSAHKTVLTYHMNRLQGLTMPRQYCVTLNPGTLPAEKETIRKIAYEHPLFDAGSVASRARLPELNGRRNTFFCGAHFGHGFHEDGARSGVAVAALLGCPLSGSS